ncbi:SdpI family protein [Bailinhaonella thermotolerans]|uniref:SdpI family protein n=1 Tax=Bailinhaonella thermotolerans TaxID=1070861 RepID=A0A3A4BAB1_9ACTN|nr:SdpI family protein [Bailinhaonella thermotolerans]RJL35849.1 SdpI family protein [Bailinhaonella thermotolerans]
MSPVFVVSLLTLPMLALLLIPFHDESGAVDTRNRLAGMRTRQTLASREAWDAAHAWLRRPLRRLAGVTAALLAVSVAGEMAFDLPGAVAAAIAVGLPAVLVGGLMLIARRADQIAARVNRQMAHGR